ncbi:MAG TPA: cytochrome c [Actinomycetota bacterium]|nr:cytochrome c [Actinomycetota bacterium]
MTEKLRDPPALERSTRRWQTVGVAVLLLLVLAFPLYRLTEDQRLDDALASENDAQIVAGRQLYALNCTSCHGERGQGVDAPALNSQEFLQSVSDAQMHGIIAGGIPGSAMPAWLDEYGGPLTDQQIAAVVAYVRSWQDTAPSVPDWRNPSGG